jgi:hypothetical protein
MNNKTNYKFIKDITIGPGFDNRVKQQLYLVNDDYYIISQTKLYQHFLNFPWETMVFPANEHGEVTDYIEIWSSRDMESSPLEPIMKTLVEEGDFDVHSKSGMD